MQVSRTPGFSQIVDESARSFVFYCRGRPVDEDGVRHLLVARPCRKQQMLRSVTGHLLASSVPRISWAIPTEFVPPTISFRLQHLADVTLVGESASATGDDYDLDELHVMVHPDGGGLWLADRRVPFLANLGSLQYGIYVDADHAYNSGAATDQVAGPSQTDPYHRPEYAILFAHRRFGLERYDELSPLEWQRLAAGADAGWYRRWI